MTWLKIGHLVKFFNVRISKNCQKLEFNLGHLGTGGKLYFHEYLQKKIKPLAIQAFFVFPTPNETGKKVVQNTLLWGV